MTWNEILEQLDETQLKNLRSLINERLNEMGAEETEEPDGVTCIKLINYLTSVDSSLEVSRLYRLKKSRLYSLAVKYGYKNE